MNKYYLENKISECKTNIRCGNFILGSGILVTVLLFGMDIGYMLSIIPITFGILGYINITKEAKRDLKKFKDKLKEMDNKHDN